MQRRKWTSKEKLNIVLEGIKGKAPLAELCSHYQISQAQYYKWRDKLLKDGIKIFETGGVDQTEQRLRNENRQLKSMIGELTIELKKSDYEV